MKSTFRTFIAILSAGSFFCAPVMGQQNPQTFSNFIANAPIATTPFGPNDVLPVIQGTTTHKLPVSGTGAVMLPDGSNAVLPSERTNTGTPPMISVVKDWGYDPTGVTQIDYTKLSGLAALGLDATVFFPAGTYNAGCPTSATAFNSAVSLRGAGTSQTTIRFSASCTLTSDWLKWDGQSGVRVSDLTIDFNTPGDMVANHNMLAFYAYAADVNGGSVDHVRMINGAGGMTLVLNAASSGHTMTGFRIEDNYLALGSSKTFQNHCVGMTTVSNAGVITKGVIARNTCVNTGMQNDGDHLVVVDNDISGVGYGTGLFAPEDWVPFTGSISGATLTITGITSGVIVAGDTLDDVVTPSHLAVGTRITDVGTCGGASPTLPCTATVSISQTVGSETMRALFNAYSLYANNHVHDGALVADSDGDYPRGFELGSSSNTVEGNTFDNMGCHGLDNFGQNNTISHNVAFNNGNAIGAVADCYSGFSLPSGSGLHLGAYSVWTGNVAYDSRGAAATQLYGYWEGGTNNGANVSPGIVFVDNHFTGAGTGSDVWLQNPGDDFQPHTSDNRLINGCGNIDQRNEGAAVTVTSGAKYTLDRWFAFANTASQSIKIQRAASANLAPGCTTEILVTNNTQFTPIATTIDYLSYGGVPGDSVLDLNYTTASARTLTLAFCAKSSNAGTRSWSLYNVNSTYSFLGSYTLASDKQQCFSFQIPGDTGAHFLATGSANAFKLFFDLGTGTNSTSATQGQWISGQFYGVTGNEAFVSETANSTLAISGVRLFKSDGYRTSTPRSYNDEIAIARSFYRKTFPAGTAPAQNAGLGGAICVQAASATAGTLGAQWAFDPNLIAPPTITTYNPSATNANWRDVTDSSDAVVNVDPAGAKGKTGVNIAEQTTALTAGSAYCIHATADGDY